MWCENLFWIFAQSVFKYKSFLMKKVCVIFNAEAVDLVPNPLFMGLKKNWLLSLIWRKIKLLYSFIQPCMNSSIIICEKIMHRLTPRKRQHVNSNLWSIHIGMFLRIWSKIKWLSLCLYNAIFAQTKWESFYFWSNSKELARIDHKFEFTRWLFLGVNLCIIFSQINIPNYKLLF